MCRSLVALLHHVIVQLGFEADDLGLCFLGLALVLPDIAAGFVVLLGVVDYDFAGVCQFILEGSLN